MPEVKRQNERLVVMLVLGIIALNFPLLSLFSRVQLLLGIPVLYLYIYFFWAIFICCLFLVLEKAPLPSQLKSSGKIDSSG